jgi:hypothetical protein
MRILSDESLYSARRSEPCLNARGERLKVTDALDLVVWEFHVEVIFKACEKFESLEAVDPELLIDIVTRLQFGPRKLEMGGGEIQDFVGRLFDRFHGFIYFTGILSPLSIDAGSGSWVSL